MGQIKAQSLFSFAPFKLFFETLLTKEVPSTFCPPPNKYAHFNLNPYSKFEIFTIFSFLYFLISDYVHYRVQGVTCPFFCLNNGIFVKLIFILCAIEHYCKSPMKYVHVALPIYTTVQWIRK